MQEPDTKYSKEVLLRVVADTLRVDSGDVLNVFVFGSRVYRCSGRHSGKWHRWSPHRNVVLTLCWWPQ